MQVGADPAGCRSRRTEGLFGEPEFLGDFGNLCGNIPPPAQAKRSDHQPKVEVRAIATIQAVRTPSANQHTWDNAGWRRWVAETLRHVSQHGLAGPRFACLLAG